jgi:hypothetical protein
MNDETMALTRELDSALNLQKLFTHTPVRSQITQEKLAKRLPAMYLSVVQKSTKQMQLMVKSLMSRHLAEFQTLTDSHAKEEFLKHMFFKIFVDQKISSVE